MALGAVIHFICNMPSWTEFFKTYFWKGQEQATKKRTVGHTFSPNRFLLSIWSPYNRKRRSAGCLEHYGKLVGLQSQPKHMGLKPKNCRSTSWAHVGFKPVILKMQHRPPHCKSLLRRFCLIRHRVNLLFKAVERL